VVDVYWRIGMHGDQPSLRHRAETRGDWVPTAPGSLTPTWRDGRPDDRTYLEHMLDVVRAAESAGFVGGLLPSFPFTDDPFATAASLLRETSTFRFMVAFQPGFLDPFAAARIASSLQLLGDGRLVYNVITGGGGPAQQWWGDRVGHDDRYARTAEFLQAHRAVWGTTPVDLDGRFYTLQGARLPEALAAQPFPEVFFSGSSPAAIEAAAAHTDYYLSWLEPFDALRQKFDAVRERAAALGTSPKFAVRIDVLARPTAEEAWDELRAGFAHVDPRRLAEAPLGDSVGAARGHSFLPATIRDVRDLEVEPGVWGGFSHLRGGPAFGLVGDYDQVAERLADLLDLGVDSFILAGVPHLEEAHRVGEEVLTRLRVPLRA
jgi:alkanesulfonate monooxygenase